MIAASWPRSVVATTLATPDPSYHQARRRFIHKTAAADTVTEETACLTI